MYQKGGPSDALEIYTGPLSDKVIDIVHSKQLILAGEKVERNSSANLGAWFPLANYSLCRSTTNQPHLSPTSKAQSDDTLLCHCLCGGVGFTITRPNARSSAFHSPWPDLIKPYHADPGADSNPRDAKWWLSSDATRYLAGTCTCISCVRSSGHDIQFWAFIPRTNILLPDGSELNFKNPNPEAMGTLKQYQSSSGVYRVFCAVCGATVFWHCDARPDLIDVSVGLMSGGGGDLLEDWLQWWTERVSFIEDAHNRALANDLGRGLRQWGLSRK
ncbi:hypothetical protein MMC09_003309 [Bachmanniomyces sp. S44760]|nr:hypothetical protein [Bachmanniomyces sp. S44760]